MRKSAALGFLCAALALGACGDSGDQASTRATTSTERETGEESVEGFGSAAGGEEREEILASERGYLRALSQREFEVACTYLSAATTESLEEVAPPALRKRGCPAIVPKVLASSAILAARDHLAGEVTKVRVDSGQAYVVYRAPGAKLFDFLMLREKGEWKVTTLSGTVLVPAPVLMG